jgi:beta-phosphoglucomutase-like phosphatase (HAD superfamily)
VGIQVAKQAGMSVVGVAHTYPYHFMQRQANWAIDHLSELDLDRIMVVLARPKVLCL